MMEEEKAPLLTEQCEGFKVKEHVVLITPIKTAPEALPPPETGWVGQDCLVFLANFMVPFVILFTICFLMLKMLLREK